MNSMKDSTRAPQMCTRSPFLMSAIQSKWSQPRAALNWNGLRCLIATSYLNIEQRSADTSAFFKLVLLHLLCTSFHAFKIIASR